MLVYAFWAYFNMFQRWKRLHQLQLELVGDAWKWCVKQKDVQFFHPAVWSDPCLFCCPLHYTWCGNAILRSFNQIFDFHHTVLINKENITDHSFSPIFRGSTLQPDDDSQLHVCGYDHEQKQGSSEHRRIQVSTTSSAKLPGVLE